MTSVPRPEPLRDPGPSRSLEPAPDQAPDHAPDPDPARDDGKPVDIWAPEIRELLGAYQQTLDRVDRLPAMVWMPMAATGVARRVKVPYLRMFLRFFVSHHINRSLTFLNRRLQAITALADNPDITKTSREMVKSFQSSLPAPPYRTLIFAAFAAALVIALPLQAVGNVFYVLDLVGALLRLDIGYAGRAFQSKELSPTLRSLFVLLMGLIVVGGLLSSPFGLKRALFNLYPWTEEDFQHSVARTHGHRVEGIYSLEADVFDHVGARRPPEGRWDLGFQTLLLVVLLVIETLLILLTVALALDLPLYIDIDLPVEGPNYEFAAPILPWWGYGLLALAGLIACGLLIWRIWHAWGARRRPAVPRG